MPLTPGRSVSVSEPSHVRIFDTTLRDGEQSPGATMTLDEKLVIARKLEELEVDVIEAGFPAASQGELESVRRIAEAVARCEVAALCRTRGGDILAAWKAIEGAAKPLLHVFIATSKLHMESKLKMPPAEVLEEIQRGVTQCRSLCPNVEFSAEDATRSDLSFLTEAIDCAVQSGATIVNIPDTVGYTMPDEYKAIIRRVLETVGTRKVIVSTHCHDDLGHAAANSLAAVSIGARQVECCVNGIGERAGNAALEEIVMALRTRPDLFHVRTRVASRHLMSASRLVSDITGIPVQPNKAIVGRNAFAHESGIHQHGMLNDTRTYEIMRAEDVGLAESKIVLGKHSGRLALQHRLAELGFHLDPSRVSVVFERFKSLADKKKNIYDEDLLALCAEETRGSAVRYELKEIEFHGGTQAIPEATVTVRVDGALRTAQSQGDGPVDAAIRAIKSCTGHDEAALVEFHLAALGDGPDAQGRVSLLVREGGKTSRGQATHTDIVVASARAFVHALNQQAGARVIEQPHEAVVAN
ncbi:MAG: 2-isopropylmalate synthase [Deltaproteobacteria bacterium]|nr:2-isopropylmalate synthase [Deltaproteobacteria bacterium]